jgi:DNA modification methylase
VVPASPARTPRTRTPAKRGRDVIIDTQQHLRFQQDPELSTEVLYCEDNLSRLAVMPAESVDLVYLDPPFFSNRHYEVIWGDEAEVRSFEDRWAGGIQVYIEWMRERVMEIHRVLKATGSVYLHCDPHASHYLKVMMDEVFGQSSFRNEVIWKRTSAHSSAKRYGPVHDVILLYAKGPEPKWRERFQPYDPDYVDMFFEMRDPDGRRWKRMDVTGAGTRKGETGNSWRGIDITAKGRHWAYPPSQLERFDAAGRLHWPEKTGGMPRLKQYLDDMPGVPLQDVWTDIRPIHNLAVERLGYPTQKPETLLDRIVQSSSDEGDVVLDPFCGCGTSIVVAHRLKRRWIGIDISPTACNLMYRRLAKVGAADIRVHGMPTTLEQLRALKPFEFQNWVIDRINGRQANRKSGDMGIDGWTFFLHDPVQIKQSSAVGRNVVDNFETAIARARKVKGAIVAFSFGRGAHEEVARVRSSGVLIHLITVNDLLDRLDWVMRQLGIADGRPDLSVAPMPQFDARRHSTDELIASATS